MVLSDCQDQTRFQSPLVLAVLSMIFRYSCIHLNVIYYEKDYKKKNIPVLREATKQLGVRSAANISQHNVRALRFLPQVSAINMMIV